MPTTKKTTTTKKATKKTATAKADAHAPATKKKAPAKAKKAKKADAGPVLRDGFLNPNGTGRKIGSNAAAVNAALTAKPQPVDAILKAAGVEYAGASSHLNALRKEGWVEHVSGEGWKLTPAGVKAQKVDPA